MIEVNRNRFNSYVKKMAEFHYKKQPTIIDVEFSVVEKGTPKEQESNEQLKIGLTKV